MSDINIESIVWLIKKAVALGATVQEIRDAVETAFLDMEG